MSEINDMIAKANELVNNIPQRIWCDYINDMIKDIEKTIKELDSVIDLKTPKINYVALQIKDKKTAVGKKAIDRQDKMQKAVAFGIKKRKETEEAKIKADEEAKRKKDEAINTANKKAADVAKKRAEATNAANKKAAEAANKKFVVNLEDTREFYNKLKKLYNQTSEYVQRTKSDVHNKDMLEKAKESLKSIGGKYFITLFNIDEATNTLIKKHAEEVENENYSEAAKMAKYIQNNLKVFKNLGKEAQKSVLNLKKDIKK